MATNLLAAARAGDEHAFASLVGPHRGELHAHCYRLMGSVHDAEDALQETLLRAWRGLPRFQERSSLRSWLYTIATNTSLNQIAKRPSRVLPIDHLPATDAHSPHGIPAAESAWIEPYPDEHLGLEDGYATPESRYERREAVELAFVAALQHLPGNQRAVLLLREVLGYSAKEAAEMLGTSVASVNSALQRARAAVQERVPDRSQQATLRALGDRAIRELVDRYVQAWERCDVPAFAALLTEDASFSMPPLASWYRGRQEIAIWASGAALSGEVRWRTLPTRANGQLALGFYAWDEDQDAYRAFAVNVLTVRDTLIGDVVAFIARPTQGPDPQAYVRWDLAPLTDLFARFGLPELLG